MGLWAGIKYAINSTLGTKHFQPLDKMMLEGLYGKDEIYDSYGEYRTIKPAHAKGIVITACAGGGAGCNYAGAYTGGYGGGGGACVKDLTIYFNATPNSETIKVVVGRGGLVNTLGSVQGGNGEATVIEGIITLPGGEGGYSNKPGVGSQPDGASGGTRTTDGGDSPYATGGKTTKYASGAANENCGTGGGASLGNGGDGGTYDSSSSYKSAKNGTLGGGGGGGYRNGNGTAGAGGDGYVKLRWIF